MEGHDPDAKTSELEEGVEPRDDDRTRTQVRGGPFDGRTRTLERKEPPILEQGETDSQGQEETGWIEPPSGSLVKGGSGRGSGVHRSVPGRVFR